MYLGKCCYKGCTKEATMKGFIYGHFTDSEDREDKIIELVACDEHAEEKDFYKYTEKENV